MVRNFNPAVVSLFVVGVFVIVSFNGDVGRARPVDGASQAGGIRKSWHARQTILDRLRPGHLALREDIAPAMVRDGFKREDYENFDGRTPRIIKAWRALEQANALWKAGHRQAATVRWSEVVQKYAATEAAFEAQVNFAQAARLCGDRNGAIRAYRQLISFPPPENAPALEKCDNERHDACAELSDLYLESGELSRALTFAELALNTYRLSDFCGVYLMSYNEGIKDRIRAIKRAIAEGRSLGIKPRGGN